MCKVCEEVKERKSMIKPRLKQGSVSLYDYCMENEDKKYLLDEWDYEKNSELGLSPKDVGTGSHVKVWWKCEKKHSYDMVVFNRTKGVNCPYCANQKVLKGFNDFASNFHELLIYWNYEKNEIKPDEITKKSNLKVWWKCEKGHEWDAQVNSVARGDRCPICSGHRVFKGYNDLASIYPDLIKEWDFEKNIIKPTEVTAGSHKKVWWKCRKGHSWETSICNRTRDSKPGCPICSNATTRPEVAIVLMLSSSFNIVKHRPKIDNTEFDICVEDLKLLIEYDGWIWHKDKRDEDSRKDIIARTNGYRFVRIWEFNSKNEWSDIINLSLDTLYYDMANGYNYAALCRMVRIYLNKLFNRDLGLIIPVNLEQRIEEYISKEKEENSIAVLFPEIAREWHPTLNGQLTAKDFTIGSRYKAYWLCHNGHTYQASISNRVLGKGCPYCANKKIIIGFNDLATTHPHLAKEFNYEKNDFLPTEIVAGTKEKIWWKCEKGHEWYVSGCDRLSGTGCPYCSNKKVLTGFNDMATTHPHLAKEFNYERNHFLPTDIIAGTNDKIWWKCEKGHEWQATGGSRVKGVGCPYCANKKVVEGFNDLATTHPNLAKEFNYEKNDFLPTDIVAGTNKYIWWKCEKGHEWKTKGSNRVQGYGCPYCAGNRKIEKSEEQSI